MKLSYQKETYQNQVVISLKNISRYSVGLLILVTTVIFGSCNKITSINDLEEATVEFNFTGVEFVGGGDMGSRAATPYPIKIDEPNIQRSTLDIGNDMLLIAELAPDYTSGVISKTNRAALKDVAKAAKETTDLAANIRYRVVVYNEDGTFNRQQEYVRGNETSAPVMRLDGGKTYTFVVYSINTTAATPEPTYSPAAQILANARVAISGNQDFMSYKVSKQMVGGTEPNRLDIILKHRFSQITTIIDATATGYNPQTITASFGPHSTTATYLFENEEITRGLENARSSLTQNLGGTALSSSYSTVINASENQVTDYQIASLRVGELTLTNLTPFQNLTVTPGMKYNLTIRLTPTDMLLNHQNQPSVLIDGRIWMRYNLGASTTDLPDQLPMTVSRHGNYYQFGRRLAVANNNSTATNNNWNGNVSIANNSWGFVQGSPPSKTTSDPCPSGFRIPTLDEFTAIMNNTIRSTTGNFNASPSNYSSAVIFTSKRNKNVKLTLPTQGVFGYTSSNGVYSSNNIILNRGLIGYYFSNNASGPVNSQHTLIRLRIQQNADDLQTVTDPGVKVFSHSVRCIAE